MLLLLLEAALLAATPALPAGAGDLRGAYDVESYALELRVDPAQEQIEGSVTVRARALGEEFELFVLDLAAELEVRSVVALEPEASGAPTAGTLALEFQHTEDLLQCRLARKAHAGDALAVRVHYGGSPQALNAFDGFHWSKTPDGKPWIATSCQSLGAHTWWPCKDSFFHPEDKPARLRVDLTVPAGLYAVSNGRLVERSAPEEGWETFRWSHEYPLATYLVTLNVGPYVAIESELELAGVEGKVPMAWYVLPADEARARAQFAELPAVLEAFSWAFGPWPFPDSKIGIVHTPFWGMEHSTAIAYGSSFPAWLAQRGEKDRYASRNRWFDYILVHEFAHEWWGNAVTAADWGDFWLHEGFATYAEGVYVERRDGREAAERFFAQMARTVPRRGSLYRGRGSSSGEAYAGLLYGKGAMVLDTLRHFVDDDEVWWNALREFQRRFRYANARTEDFQAVLEELSGREWGRFFAEWVHGSGYPSLSGAVRRAAPGLVLEIDNEPAAPEGFQVPLDLSWIEGEREQERRLWLEPGASRIEIPCAAPPRDVRVVHLARLLGKHDVKVE
jgi:aminopeptidase N